MLWLAAVGYPIAAGSAVLLATPRTDVETHHAGQVLMNSSLWAILVAVGAALLGWAPGRVLGKSLHKRGYVLLAAIMLAPICLPAYVVFFAWWQSWPADSAFFAWIQQHGLLTAARYGTLFLGLLCWSWPLVAWSVAGSASLVPRQREELMRVDGASIGRRMGAMLRSDGRGLAVGFLLVFLITFNNTTCFDLADIFTFGNELRAVAALGASSSDIMMLGMPAMLIAAVGAVVVWLALTGRPRRAPTDLQKPNGVAIASTGVIWLITLAALLSLITINLARRGGFGGHLSEFIELYGPAGADL